MSHEGSAPPAILAMLADPVASFGKTFVIVGAIVFLVIFLTIVYFIATGDDDEKYKVYTSGASLRTESEFTQPIQGAGFENMTTEQKRKFVENLDRNPSMQIYRDLRDARVDGY